MSNPSNTAHVVARVSGVGTEYVVTTDGDLFFVTVYSGPACTSVVERTTWLDAMRIVATLVDAELIEERTPARFEIVSQTDFDTMSIVTIRDHADSATWTLVACADGIDVLTSSTGQHIEASSTFVAEQHPEIAELLAWIVANV